MASLPAPTVSPVGSFVSDRVFDTDTWYLSRQRWNRRPSLPTFHKRHNHVLERRSTALMGDKCARWLIRSQHRAVLWAPFFTSCFSLWCCFCKGWMSLIFFSYYFHSNCVSVWRSGALISTAVLVWWLHEKVCVTCDPPRVYSCLFLRGCWEYNDSVLVGRVECGWCLASSFCLCLLRQPGVSSSRTQGPNPLVIHPALVESACPRSVPLSAPVLSGNEKKRSHPIMKGCLTI